MLGLATEIVYLNVIEDVISKTRYSGVYTGELEESILNEFQKKWEAKLMKAGIISRPIPTPSPLETQIPTHLHGNAAESSVDINLQFPRMNPYTIPTHLQWNADNPSLADRSVDIKVQFPGMNPYTDLVAFRKIKRDGFHIPQQDGAGTGVGDGLNVFVKIENNDDELLSQDDEPLNEADDVKEEDIDTADLVLAQYDKVKRIRNQWKCILKSGIMLLNNKELLFSEATADFKF